MLIELEIRKLLEATIGTNWRYVDKLPSLESVNQMLSGVATIFDQPLSQYDLKQVSSYAWDLVIAPILFAASNFPQIRDRAVSHVRKICGLFDGSFAMSHQVVAYHRAIEEVAGGGDWSSRKISYTIWVSEAYEKDNQSV
jgi:hypothetical protein